MPKTIARLNIEHFRKLLERETDETKRQTIRGLLAEEEENSARWKLTRKSDKAIRPFAPIRASAWDAHQFALRFLP